MATSNDSPTNFSTASLTSAIQRLMLDPDHADLVVTCGDREWKVHSAILAVRSPFFKAAVTNNMVEKLDMKIDIKELDPNIMEHVINFMYGVSNGNVPVQFMFEAAERFQMKDLKEYAVKIAKKEMSVENVVEFAHIAELYSIEDFLANCATFIAVNDVPLSGYDMSFKLAVMVMGILKDANRKLQDSENKLKAEVEWIRLDKFHVNGQQLEYAGNGKVGLALAKMPLLKNNHYFEMEIIGYSPGLNCRIFIGLAWKDYPRGKLPGFVEGSIGYDMSNGRLYMGIGRGYPFGSRCNKGDIVGCGVMFPSEAETGKMVQVYFSKNGKVIGNKEMMLPMGGFFPTVAMYGSIQAFRVDLKPDSN